MIEEVLAEVGTLRQLIDMLPEDQCIDRASLYSRMSEVLKRGIIDASKEVARAVRTTPEGLRPEPDHFWWTADGERAVEGLVKLVELAQANGVSP